MGETVSEASHERPRRCGMRLGKKFFHWEVTDILVGGFTNMVNFLVAEP